MDVKELEPSSNIIKKQFARYWSEVKVSDEVSQDCVCDHLLIMTQTVVQFQNLVKSLAVYCLQPSSQEQCPNQNGNCEVWCQEPKHIVRFKKLY